MKYRTIVIDFPWDVRSNMTKRGYKETLPYKTMKDEEIIIFPIDKFADENCDLFLWVVHSKLPTAMYLLQEWGFKYHCLMTWDKLNGICINGFHRKTELILYGYRGKMGVKSTPGNYIPTLISEKLTVHSAKPKKFYKYLRERTEEPRIDIFARRNIKGFDMYGDQLPTEKQIFLD